MGARPSSFTKTPPEALGAPEGSEAASTPAPGLIVPQWQPSPQQQAIYDWFSGGVSRERQPHLVVRARAGTGKTTTIIEGVNRAPERRILLCAFNKKIAEELNTRLSNPRATAKTLHALGYAAIRKMWPLASVNNDRGMNLSRQVCGANTPLPILRLVTSLHTKGREMMPLDADLGGLTALALRFDLEPDESWEGLGFDLGYVAESALEVMTRAANEPPKNAEVDYADMIYLPLAWNLLAPSYDLVAVDECQDMTISQLEVAQRLCQGRLCLVGDDRQAIYGFRGADSGSIDRLKAELQAEECPLTVTYRCGKAIVARAQRLVPDIEAAPGNPEGVVDRSTYEQMLRGAQPGDFLLSRLNAPLVAAVYALIKHRVRARMAGKDLGAGITHILTRLKVRPETPVEEIGERLAVWEAKTTTRQASYGHPELAERTRDQAGMIRAILDECETASDVLEQLQWLFTNEDNTDEGHVLCSSVHKAKGLEADRVWVLQDSLYRRGESMEECNIDYVATTRAKSCLQLVEGGVR